MLWSQPAATQTLPRNIPYDQAVYIKTPRKDVNSWRRRKASHSPNAISAVTIGTGDGNATLQVSTAWIAGAEVSFAVH